LRFVVADPHHVTFVGPADWETRLGVIDV
jgi:tRNA threonylcarbamoyladenosine biosynthesis protein TsaE